MYRLSPLLLSCFLTLLNPSKSILSLFLHLNNHANLSHYHEVSQYWISLVWWFWNFSVYSNLRITGWTCTWAISIRLIFWFFNIGLYELFWILFLWYVVCKHFLPFHRLPFHFVNFLLLCSSFLVNVVPLTDLAFVACAFGIIS